MCLPFLFVKSHNSYVFDVYYNQFCLICQVQNINFFKYMRFLSARMFAAEKVFDTFYLWGVDKDGMACYNKAYKSDRFNNVMFEVHDETVLPYISMLKQN